MSINTARRVIDPSILNGMQMMAPLMGNTGGVIDGLRQEFGLKDPAGPDVGFNAILKPQNPGM